MISPLVPLYRSLGYFPSFSSQSMMKGVFFGSSLLIWVFLFLSDRGSLGTLVRFGAFGEIRRRIPLCLSLTFPPRDVYSKVFRVRSFP